jgi:uroporphyrinogen decarboxylase
MNSRDRILAAMYLEEPDEVPLFDFIVNPRTLEGITGKKGVRVNGAPDEYLEANKALHLDMIAVYEDGMPWKTKIVAPGLEEDEWRIRWRPREDAFIGFYAGGPIRNEEDLETFQIPDPHAPGRLQTAKAVLKIVDGQMAVGSVVNGPFTHAFMLNGGLDNFVRNLYVNPRFASRLVEMAKDFYIELGKQCIDLGSEVLIVADDYGHKGGPLISPKLFREYIFPALKEMIDCFKKRGAAIFFHSDGNVNLIMDDLVRMGIQCINPIERKAGMDLEEIKRRYGERVCLHGNLDATGLMYKGTRQDIHKQVKECYEIGAPGGGYIFGTDGGEIPPHVSPETAKFTFDTALKYRAYPYAS